MHLGSRSEGGELVSLRQKVLRMGCVAALVASLGPSSAFAQEGESGKEGLSEEVVRPVLVEEFVDRTNVFDLKDAVVHPAAVEKVLIAPLAADGDTVSQKVQAAYDLISREVQGGSLFVDVEELALTGQEMREVMDLVLCNPELWWLSNGFTLWTLGSCVSSVSLGSLFEESELPSVKAEVEASVAEALSWIDDDWSDFEKAQALHDYLVRTCQYDLNVAAGETPDPATTGEAGALSGAKTPVCHGYAMAYKLLLKRAGIDAVYVASDEMNHAWNMVNIDGSWYHVDVTWDDPVYTDPQTNKLFNLGFDAAVSHAHFLKSDQSFLTAANAHRGWNTSLVAPVDYTAEGFTYPVYKAPYVRDCATLGHRSPVVQIADVIEATCTAEGSYYEVSMCPSCKAEVSRSKVTVAARGHVPATRRVNVKAATCSQKGSYDEETYCKTCSAIVSRATKTTSALGHSYGTYVSNNDAQVGVDGTKTATCSRCGVKRTIADEGSALPSPSEPESPEKPETPSTPAQPTAPSNPSTGSTTTPTVKPSTPAPPSSGSSTTTKPAPTPAPAPSKPVTSPSTPAKPVVKPAAKAPTFKKTKISKLKSSKKKTLTVTWKKATKSPVKYQVQYSTDKKFKKGVKTATIKVTKKLSRKSSLSTTVKKLKSKKTYYVRVRAEYSVAGKTYNGPWTATKKVKVK
ncbi:MAG: transglutaminase domain-containing protein [Adlercreutzia sp.]|nr:transglutaminase domain-containing protein [Adlercreutzia sp.]